VPIPNHIQTSSKETKTSLAKDNYILMEEHNLFEKLEVDGD
jgi:hypothetical protein